MPETHPRSPAYRVETERLVIRCWEPRDAPALQLAINESLEYLRPWMPWVTGEPQTPEAKVNLLRGFRARFDLDEDLVYGLFSRDEVRVLGGSGLHARVGPKALEIGYWIHADGAGQGLATEAAGALTRVGFEVNGVERMEIHCDPENAPSARVAEKLGYRHEATLRARGISANGGFRDDMVWTMLRPELADSAAAKIEFGAFDVVGERIL